MGKSTVSDNKHGKAIKNMKCLKEMQARLRSKFHSSKLTLHELEERTGISDSTINSILNGDRLNTQIDTLISIAKGLDTSIDYCVGLTDHDSTSIELRKFCELTGLSLQSIEQLSFIKYMGDFTSSLNEILTYEELPILLADLRHYFDYRAQKGYSRIVPLEDLANKKVVYESQDSYRRINNHQLENVLLESVNDHLRKIKRDIQNREKGEK